MSALPVLSVPCLLPSPNSELLGVLKLSALVLDGVSAFPRVSREVCPPSRWFCFPLVSPCPLVPLLVSLCWMVCRPSRAFVRWGVSASLLVSPCLPAFHRVLSPLSPHVSHCLPLSPLVSHCLLLSPFLFPFLFLFAGWCLLPEGLVSRFLPLTPLLPLLVCLSWMVCPPSEGTS